MRRFMHKLSKVERENKRRGKFHSNWRSKRNKALSKHILSTERWLLIVPIENSLPRAYLSEKKANHVASSIAGKLNINVEIDHQTLNDKGEWVSY